VTPAVPNAREFLASTSSSYVDACGHIRALIAECERLQRIADDFQNRWKSERQINESQISGGMYPDGSRAW